MQPSPRTRASPAKARTSVSQGMPPAEVLSQRRHSVAGLWVAIPGLQRHVCCHSTQKQAFGLPSPVT